MNEQIHLVRGANAEDMALVEQMLICGSNHFSMTDTTVTSRVMGTIRCYSERYGGGFAIGARVHQDLIIVDLVPGRKPSPRFPEVRDYFITEFPKSFGERYHLATEAEFIKWQSTLPPSEAALEFHRQHA